MTQDLSIEAQTMRDIMAALDDTLNLGLRGMDKTIGVVLLTFPFGTAEGATTNYISNGASRAEIAVMLKEVAARLQGQPHLVGRA